MKKNKAYSDESYNLQGAYERKNSGVFEKKENDFIETFTFADDIHSAWIDDRTIQKMRETELQMRKREGAWAKVLSLHKLSQKQTTNGLCSFNLPPTGVRIFGKLSESQTDSGRNLYDKPRASSEKRETLKLGKKHGRSSCFITTGYYIRHRFSWYFSSQYG